MAISCESVVKTQDFTCFLRIFEVFDDHHDRRRSWGDHQAMMSTFALCQPGRATSYESACADMFAWLGNRLGLKKVPAKSGLSRARERVGDDGVKRLWRMALEWTNARLAPVKELIPGWRLIAADGMGMIMPRSASTSAAYGIRRTTSGEELSHYPEARLVSAWDVERRLPVAANVASVLAKGGERKQFLDILDETPENSVIIFDSGIPSRDIFGEILASGRHFVARMVATASGAGSWREISEFLASGQISAIVDMTIGSGKTQRIQRMRLVRRVFKRGRPGKGQKRQLMVIATSLDETQASDDTIIKLYHKRWAIETIHDELKNQSNIETWHSKTAKGIEQEIYCHLLWRLLIGHTASHIEAEIQQQNPEREIRTNSANLGRHIVEIVDCLLQCVIQKSRSVRKYLQEHARWRLDLARKSYVTRRARKSRPRKPFHPYSKPRRTYGK